MADPALAAYGKLLDARGRLLRLAALRVYAAAIGPLPGVEPAALGDAPGQFAGSALRVLARDLDSLPPGVRQRVQQTLTELAGGAEASDEPVSVEVVPATGSGAGESAPAAYVPLTIPEAAEVTAQVEEIRSDFIARSGHRIRMPIRVRVVPHTPGDDPVSTDFTSRCVIALPHSLYDDPDESSIRSTLAHEVWHCFQFSFSPAAPADWIFEGQAEWAGEDYVDGSPSSASRWDTWLLTNSTSLWRRSYDAIGLYAVAAQTGADPWRTMLPMMNQSGARALATLFGSEGSAALRATAEALTRDPSLGANWESTGPGITGAENSPTLTITEGSRSGTRIDTGPFGTMSVNLDVQEGDVLHLETGGGDVASLELQGLDAVQIPGAGTLTLCLKEGGCACPDGTSPGGGDALPQARPGAGAASIGSLRASHVVIRGQLESLEDACEEELVTGEWHAPVGPMWRQLMQAYGGSGGAGGMQCDGDYFLTLAEDSAWQLRYAATCRLLDRAGRGRARLVGTYTVGDGTLDFTHTGGSGTFTMNGITQPLPGLDGLRSALVGRATYSIEGNQMRVTTTVPDGHTFAITWTRVG